MIVTGAEQEIGYTATEGARRSSAASTASASLRILGLRQKERARHSSYTALGPGRCLSPDLSPRKKRLRMRIRVVSLGCRGERRRALSIAEPAESKKELPREGGVPLKLGGLYASAPVCGVNSCVAVDACAPVWDVNSCVVVEVCIGVLKWRRAAGGLLRTSLASSSTDPSESPRFTDVWRSGRVAGVSCRVSTAGRWGTV